MEKRLYQDHPKLAKIPLSMDERRAANAARRAISLPVEFAAA